MNPSLQKNVSLFFMIFPTVMIILMIWIVRLPITHPFILLNFGLITMGAGLSKDYRLFNPSVVVTMLIYIYSAFTLPTPEATKATTSALENLSNHNTPVTIWQAFEKWRS